MTSDNCSNEMLPIAILAGGVATRLRPITEKIPKALVEVLDEPFIAHQLRLLKQNGFKKVIMCLGYKGEMIEDVIGNGNSFGLEVKYSYDGEKLLGTGGALAKALPLLGNEFFVTYGDAYLECDYKEIQKKFFEFKKDAMLTIFHNKGAWDTSNIIYKNDKIINYDKINRTPEMQYIDYGVSVLTKKIIMDFVDRSENFDLADLYHDLVKKGQMAGFETYKRFYEIGSVSGLEEMRDYLASKL